MKIYSNSIEVRRIIIAAALLVLCGSSQSAEYLRSLNERTDFKHSQSSSSIMQERIEVENQELPNPFAITFYKQNYFLPYYYTGSPYNKIYKNQIPDGEKLNRSELKYQLSFKVPIWNKILNSKNSIYFAYTQLSYWQLYNKKSFFRSTDYEPEFFLQNELGWNIFHDWHLDLVKLGIIHQSNGFGTSLERSWNRVYVEANISNPNMLISVKPWIAFYDSTYRKFNPDMTKYLGYGEILLAYKFGKQVVSLQSHSLIERRARYATGIFTYSFPITPYINGFAQIFSGYGQSLIEYNKRSNSAGVGLALNNFI